MKNTKPLCHLVLPTSFTRMIFQPHLGRTALGGLYYTGSRGFPNCFLLCPEDVVWQRNGLLNPSMLWWDEAPLKWPIARAPGRLLHRAKCNPCLQRTIKREMSLGLGA